MSTENKWIKKSYGEAYVLALPSVTINVYQDPRTGCYWYSCDELCELGTCLTSDLETSKSEALRIVVCTLSHMVNSIENFIYAE